ncbi:MAG: hypothetical protein DRO40_09230 [Thermoprotei archaeon]|nr:MAG: hypothetical protein DRO40_09230 [Thermoprotei archaeon]
MKYGFTRKFTIFFLLPTLVIISIFLLYPMVFTFYLSFHEWRGAGAPVFVGLKNYITLTQKTVYKVAFINNLLWVALMVPLVIIFGFFLALFLREHVLGATAIKSAIFLGMVIPQVVAGIVFLFIYDPHAGIVNALLQAIGVIKEPVPWLSLKTIHIFGVPISMSIFVIIISSIWVWIGFTMTIYIAAIESIPHELIEAAEIDGLSFFQKVRWVIWPMVKPATTVAILMSIVWALKVFDILYAMGGEAGPPPGTDVLAYRMYIDFVYGKYGIASAIAVILAIMIFTASFILLRKVIRGAGAEHT